MFFPRLILLITVATTVEFILVPTLTKTAQLVKDQGLYNYIKHEEFEKLKI
jgi:hypothetical protein